jgi:hypothetical protein
MNWRGVVIVSIGLNLLLGAVVLKAHQNRAESAARGTSATVVFKTNVLTRTTTNHLEQPPSGPPPDVVWPRWNEIASEDLMEYRAALERIGCPVDTLRDILETEVQRRHFAERQALMEPVSRVFWDLLARDGFDDDTPLFNAFHVGLESLKEKYEKLTAELFDGVADRHTETPVEMSAQYAHLNDETRVQLAGLDARLNEQRRALFKDEKYRNEDHELTVEGQALLNQLEADRLAHVRELTSDEEFHEYRLRSSGAANWAANRPGFEPSGEELRQIAEWKLALEEEHRLPDGRDADDHARNIATLEIQSELNPRMKELFGEERFEAYIRSSSSDYQALYDLGDRFNLPETTVTDAWEMQRAAKAAAQQIRNDTALTPDEQRDALRAIQQETYQSFETLLSDDIDQAYIRRSGDWINELSPAVD